MRGQTPIESDRGCFLEVGGEVFASGLYAHAPSRWAFDLGRKWKTLNFGYGLKDGFDGSVVFIILKDGKEAFRSHIVKEHQVQRSQIDVTDTETLELIVEDGGDGTSRDWGLWLEPVLRRHTE